MLMLPVVCRVTNVSFSHSDADTTAALAALFFAVAAARALSCIRMRQRC